MTKPILILLTSHDKLGDTGNDTGFHWVEMTTPYYRFRDAGHDIVLASVQGGRPPADPNSMPDDPSEVPESVKRFNDDQDAMQALSQTKAVADLNAGDYSAIYIPGGHGTMWDFRQTPDVGKIVSDIYAQGGVVGSVCHGPAALLNATKPNGEKLVKGKKVNCFSDEEERKAELEEVVPFLLESELRAQGGNYEKSGEAFEGHAVRDGRLITGQNPASVEELSTLFLKAMQDEDRAAA